MNTNQNRSATFKWQGFLCTSLAFVHLFGTAAVPLPFVVAAAAASDAKTGRLEIEGRGGIGGGESSELLFEQLEVPHDEDHDKKKVGGGSWKTAGGSHNRKGERNGILDQGKDLNSKDAAVTNDKATIPIIEPFSVDDGMKELDDLSRSLRGSGSNDIDSAGVLFKVKELALSYFSSIQVIQGHFQDDNKEEAMAALKSTVGVADQSTKKSWKVKLGHDVGFRESSGDVASTAAKSLASLSDIPDDQLAQFVEPQVFDQLADYTQDLVNLLEDFDQAMILGKNEDEEKDQASKKQQSSQGFKFDSTDTSESRFNGKKPHFQFDPKILLNYQSNDLLNHQNIKHMSKSHMYKQRNFGSFFATDDIIMAKHQARVESLGEGICQQTCDPDEVTCHCENLFACVGNMTKYDLAVLIAGGFIDSNSESDQYGNFTISAKSLSLFDAEEGVKDKLARIQNTAIDSTNLTQCKAVLDELFTACDPSKVTCSNPNTESFQVSTEQVCDVVNTPKKLLFEVIGDEFDGFDDEQASSKCEPLSFDVCRDFVAEFDRLYEATISETNPMRKNSGVSLQGKDTLTIFQHTQFPVEYWYPQDERGIVDRSFDYHHWLVCGIGEAIPDKCNGVETQKAVDSDLHAVRCCADSELDTAGDHWEKEGTCQVWGESDVPNEDDCHDKVTFEEAEGICEAAGARLCTRRELLDGCTAGTGCGYDDKLTWSSNSVASNEVSGHFAIVNPATGKALGLSGTSCDPAPGAPGLNFGPRVEVQDYNPYNSRQHFTLEGNGKIRSEGCRWSNGGKLLPLFLTPEDIQSTTGLGGTNQCTGGSKLILRRGDARFTQTWKVGVDGTIAIDLDCTVYQTGNLVISAIDDDDIDHYENLYFSIVNPASGLALSVQGTSCSMHSVTKVRTYNKDDDDQKFKLVKMGDKFLIKSKACALMVPTKKGRFLSALDCTEEASELILGPRKFCITAVTGFCTDCRGKLNVFVDSGNGRGYVLETTNVDKEYVNGQQVMKKCYDGLEGVQVHGPIGDAWGGYVSLSVDGGNTWQNLICTDCTGSTNTMPIGVSGDSADVGFSTKCKNGATCTLVPSGEIQYNRLWDIKYGKLELDGCGSIASIDTSTYPPSTGTEMHVHPDGDAWSQKWTLISDSAILTTEDGGSNQEWKASFVSPPYNYALLPQQSFPGTLETVGPDTCLSSTDDPEVSKAAMHYCDASMSLLIGSQTSLGTLRAIADVVAANGLDYMPGRCCFDSPTSNSAYFGVEFDPNLMTCQHSGPMHLGISEEACETAGGKWFRTPCITLKEAIDARPFKFNIDSPISGNCQDELLQVNTAYVEASTHHANFTFTSDDSGCNEFCRSLPDCTEQIAMMTGWSGQTTSIADTCVCIYPDGGVPSADLLPEYAIRSPPKFSLTDPTNSMALGISSGYDCTFSEITIEAQDNVTSVRHQFHLTYDHRLSSAACPEKVITADCATGMVMLSNATFGQTALNQHWNFNDDGSITNTDCPSFQLSATKDDISSLESFYFSLVNPATSLVMGVKDGGSCVDGIDITLQKAVPGSSNQQFYYEENSGEIVSVMCPDLVIGENLAPSSSPSMAPSVLNTSSTPTNSLIPGDECDHKNLQLKTRATANDAWLFNDDGSVESNNCVGKVIDIETGGKLSARAGSAMILSDHSEEKFSIYQKWTRSHLKLSVLSGPYSLVNSAGGLAIGTEIVDCTNGMALTKRSDNHTSSNQQFYIGSVGSIHSVKCPGMVIGMEGSVASSCLGRLTLQTATGEDATKWVFNYDGTIKSVLCPNSVIGSKAANIVLSPSTDGQMWRKVNTRLLAANEPAWTQNWDINFVEEYNTDHVLDKYYVVCGSGGYTCPDSVQIQESLSDELYAVHCCASTGCLPGSSPGCLSATFSEAKEICEKNGARLCTKEELLSGCAINTGCNFNNVLVWSSTPSLPARLQNMTCYEPSDAFSPSFEDFAKDLVIDDAAEEDQCRNTREQLGYERDYPFDTEVRDRFFDYMCNGEEFTAVDQLSEGLSGPPVFEEVEYDAPEYPDDPELSLQKLPRKANFQTPKDYGKNTGYNNAKGNQITHLEKTKMAMDTLIKTFESQMDFESDSKANQCDIIPQFIGLVANPLYLFCQAGKFLLLNILWILYSLYHVASMALDHALYAVTVGGANDHGTHLTSVAMFENFKVFDEWVHGSLETINVNMFTQHTEMREHLQDRHQEMTTNIVEFLEESTNTVAGYFTLQTDWLHDNLCVIYKEVSGATTCDGTEDTLLSLVGLSLWDKMLRIEAQGESLTKEIQMVRSVGVDEEAGDGTQRLLQAGTEARDLESIHHAKMDDVEAKMDAMEGKVDAVEANVQEVKANMKEVKDQMDKMEGKMDKMAEMILKMMSMLAKEE